MMQRGGNLVCRIIKPHLSVVRMYTPTLPLTCAILSPPPPPPPNLCLTFYLRYYKPPIFRHIKAPPINTINSTLLIPLLTALILTILGRSSYSTQPDQQWEHMLDKLVCPLDVSTAVYLCSPLYSISTLSLLLSALSSHLSFGQGTFNSLNALLSPSAIKG